MVAEDPRLVTKNDHLFRWLMMSRVVTKNDHPNSPKDDVSYMVLYLVLCIKLVYHQYVSESVDISGQILGHYRSC